MFFDCWLVGYSQLQGKKIYFLHKLSCLHVAKIVSWSGFLFLLKSSDHFTFSRWRLSLKQTGIVIETLECPVWVRKLKQNFSNTFYIGSKFAWIVYHCKRFFITESAVASRKHSFAVFLLKRIFQLSSNGVGSDVYNKMIFLIFFLWT
jgi:hypothetical protein